MRSGTRSKGKWYFKCHDQNGKLKWQDTISNLVVDQGLNYALGAAIGLDAKINSWSILLTDAAPTVAPGDTMASKAWTEFVDYSEGTRPAWVPGAVTNKSLNNNASVGTATVTQAGTVGGGGLVASSVKGSTSAGDILYSVGSLDGGDRAVAANDILSISSTFTQADDGV